MQVILPCLQDSVPWPAINEVQLHHSQVQNDTSPERVPQPTQVGLLVFDNRAIACVFRAVPTNTVHSPNFVLMLGQRRRRWANIETALGECPVFARVCSFNT